MKTLSSEQLNILGQTAKEVTPIYFPIIYTAGHTGMRKSELTGLTWNNVDLNSPKPKIYVRQTITEANGKYFTNQRPKNNKARSVMLTNELAKLLKELKEQNDKRKKILGKTYNPLDLVFCNSAGNIIAGSELSRSLKKALKAANLPDIRFHDLRHSHATLLLQAGIHPKIVSDRLGHTKVGITLDLYSHVTATIQEQAVTALNELLN
ncbi:site-specific integrase [Bacillus sp. EB600]|uniref:site-specific integrase n=1 Tax=Bacillus sp. EB600 TaxID=2806345 RepID=UPI00210CC453|nr:site-specific integrase [Bacillus sp. EB600]